MEELQAPHPVEETEQAAAAETDVNATEDSAQPEARRKYLAAAAVLAVLLLPVFYLIVKFSAPKTPANGPSNAAAATPVNLPALEEAVRASPTAANKVNLSAAYLDQQQPGRAVPLLSDVLASDPRNATAWNNLCVARMQQQDFPAAIDACQHAVAAKPDFALAQNNLKWATGERQRAVDDIAAIGKMAPGDRTEAVYLREGMDALHTEQYDAAIAAWSEMLKTNPRSLVAANNIGTAYMLNKQYEQGEAWFEKALSFDASSQLAKNNLAWAKGELAKSR
jgi:tetratricopeptide (TPR) repeat protein